MYPLSISGKTKNVEELRRLGVMIAENLNINFFDYPNCSPHRTLSLTNINTYINIYIPSLIYIYFIKSIFNNLKINIIYLIIDVIIHYPEDYDYDVVL